MIPRRPATEELSINFPQVIFGWTTVLCRVRSVGITFSSTKKAFKQHILITSIGMQLRKATTFIASTALFLPLNSNASLLRGDDREVDRGDTLEITEDRPGTFLKVSESDIV